MICLAHRRWATERLEKPLQVPPDPVQRRRARRIGRECLAGDGFVGLDVDPAGLLDQVPYFGDSAFNSHRSTVSVTVRLTHNEYRRSDTAGH